MGCSARTKEGKEDQAINCGGCQTGKAIVITGADR